MGSSLATMRFRICGDLDAPEWLLREVGVLSQLPNLRIKVLTGMVIKHILGEGIDFQKVDKMVSAADLDTSDVKALIAALTFIVSNSAKYNVEDETIRNELQQFGLPKEHCDSIARSFTGAKEILQEHFVEQTFSLPKLSSVNWKINYVMCNDEDDVNAPLIQLQLGVNNPETSNRTLAFELDQDKFNVFLGELKQAREVMENIHS